LSSSLEIKSDPLRRPIFVHASARSGSTYFFNVLRRADSLLCFNEAINDEFSYGNKSDYTRSRIDFARRAARGERPRRVHYFLSDDGKAEFLDAWDSFVHLYPRVPSFRDYLPPGGILPSELRKYLTAIIEYAQAHGKRPALCEIFSRGRVGALRDAFGGFHVAQFRDPLSQFGSCFRSLQETGGITFMIIPLLELGVNGEHPLYSLVPEAWRVPVLPWPAGDDAQRWVSTQQYLSTILSPRADALERTFRLHMLSWFLNNVASVVHSDFVLDIDKAFDDLSYRESVRGILSSELGAAPDLSDITKYSRYYRFDGVDTKRVCGEVTDFVFAAQKNGSLQAALDTLSRTSQRVSTSAAIELLSEKLEAALSASASTERAHCVSATDWEAIVQRNRRFWTDPRLLRLMQSIFPFVFPVVQATRRIRGMV
jgi:hypothetical protein